MGGSARSPSRMFRIAQTHRSHLMISFVSFVVFVVKEFSEVPRSWPIGRRSEFRIVPIVPPTRCNYIFSNRISRKPSISMLCIDRPTDTL